jgi:anthranilate synthase component 1
MDNSVQHEKYPLGNTDPLEVYLRLRSVDDHCFILESLEGGARWTFIGWDPLFELSINDGHVTQTHTPTGKVLFSEDVADMNTFLKNLLESHKRERITDLPPFSGGLMGYFAYDYVKYQEPKLKDILERTKDGEKFNDCDLMFFDKVIAIDHITSELHIILNPTSLDEHLEGGQSELNARSCYDTEAIYTLITSAEYEPRPKLELNSEVKYRFSEDEFTDMIRDAKGHINEGDIFQVVLSNRVEFDATGSLFDVYKTLRETNPSPYMFYMSSKHLEIAGASPETLVSATFQGDALVASTYPLAGTRPRGNDDREDDVLAEDLLNDEKELAEHNMLVDLGRNDIGKIAEIGSVEVPKYMDVLKFSHVMHIGSKVVGKVKPSLTAVDVISSVLPAGTLSGAPKVRAMEIIDCLENDNRGVYGGCLGYLSVDGQMDMCITIRTAYMKGEKVYARAGAGIVMGSKPHAEYQEIKNKLKAVLNAIETPSGGDVK